MVERTLFPPRVGGRNYIAIGEEDVRERDCRLQEKKKTCHCANCRVGGNAKSVSERWE